MITRMLDGYELKQQVNFSYSSLVLQCKKGLIAGLGFLSLLILFYS
uniref:Uncharacterized protein n=1 Tax=Anguilla anguilla TaxID=7936 RepID=A0A0E9QHZ7_ANGAN